MADEPATSEPGPGPGQDPVPPLMIVLLAIYLVALTGVLLWGIYRSWPSCVVVCTNQTAAASPSPTPTPTATAQQTQTPTPTQPPTATPTPTPTPPPTQTQSPTPVPTPTIESVSPKTGLINCNIQVTIKGKNFKKGVSVIFGGVPATIVGPDDPSGQFINVQPPSHPEGDVDLVVKNPDGTTSDIAKAAFSYSCPPSPETDLFLLVIFAGALGGALHGLRSLYWYVGLRSLLRSWTLMYVLLPFTGAIIAVIFYAVIRAGLLPIQTSKNTAVAMIAVSVLVGLFSQQAALKLKDIFDAFFSKPGAGPPTESKPQGSLPPGGAPSGQGAPKPTFDKAQGKAGDKVQIKGTGMKTVESVTFGTVAAKEFTIKDGVITVTVPEQPSGTAPKVNVVVKGDTGPFTLEFTYQQ